VLVGIGLIGGCFGVQDLRKGLDAGRWELALSVTFVVVGGLGAFWARRTMAPAAAADQDAVAARGLRTDLLSAPTMTATRSGCRARRSSPPSGSASWWCVCCWRS